MRIARIYIENMGCQVVKYEDLRFRTVLALEQIDENFDREIHIWLEDMDEEVFNDLDKFTGW